MDIIPYILINAGITRYDPEEMRDELSAHHEIRWDQVPDTTHMDLLKKGAEERGIKPYEMSFGEMSKGFDYLDGANLDKQYQYFQDHPERGDKDIMEFMFEKTNMVKILIHEITTGEEIDWAKVPKTLIRGVLKQAARTEEMAVYKLRDKQLKKRYKFLGNHNLASLYEYAENAPERGDRDVVEYLFETVDMSQELIESIRRGGRIDWQQVFPSMQLSLVKKAAAEIGVPVRFLKDSDLRNHEFKFLRGKNLDKLYKQYERSADRIAQGEPILQYMFDKIDAPQIEVADVIDRLINPKFVEWARVPHAVKRELVFAAAEEVGKPVGMLTEGDLKRHAYDFLEGKTLKRLYDHAQNHPQRNGRPVIPFLLELIGADKISAEEIRFMIRTNKDIQWGRVPDEVIRDILKKVAAEKKKPVYSLERDDFTEPVEYLDGKSLYNLYQAYESRKPKDGSSVTSFIHESIGMVQEVVVDLQEGKPIYWSKMNPAVMRNLLVLFAQNLPTPKPACFVYIDDLKNNKLEIFGNRNIAGLEGFARKLPDAYSKQPTSEKLRQHVGIPEAKGADLIEMMDIDSPILWNQVPKAAVRDLIFIAARELRKSPYQLTSYDFRQPIRAWGDKTLWRLYEYGESIPKRGEYRSVVDHIFFFAGMFEEEFVDTYIADHPAEGIRRWRR